MRRFERGSYRFCSEPDCQIVYFDTAGHVFTTRDLRVPVWQKEPPGARMICYCFDENETDISAEVERTGTSRAVDRVRGHLEAGRCACEVRNPKGACCLGDVIQAVKRIVEHV
jgi:Zinc binding domain